MNLYNETIKILNKRGKTIEDIVFICGAKFEISIDNFIEVAKKTDYDSGYGAQEVAEDLKIVGTNWYLERAEYDGSEWWEFKKLPERPIEKRPIEKLAGGMWNTLAEIQDIEED